MCSICKSPPKTRRLHLDHDHRRMVLRSVLCFRCNSALRPYMTSDWLRSAADYLEKYEGE